jgi:hypothetical protein
MSGESLAQLSRVMDLFYRGKSHPRYTQGNSKVQSSNSVALPLEVALKAIPVEETRAVIGSFAEENDDLSMSDVIKRFEDVFGDFAKTDLGIALKLIADVQNSGHLVFSPLFFDNMVKENEQSELAKNTNIVPFFIALYMASLSKDLDKYESLNFHRLQYANRANLHFDSERGNEEWEAPVLRVLFQEYIPELSYCFSAYAVREGQSLTKEDLRRITFFDDLPDEKKVKLELVGKVDIAEGDVILFTYLSFLEGIKSIAHQVVKNGELLGALGSEGCRTIQFTALA